MEIVNYFENCVPAIPIIQMKLSSIIASLFSIMLNYILISSQYTFSKLNSISPLDLGGMSFVSGP